MMAQSSRAPEQAAAQRLTSVTGAPNEIQLLELAGGVVWHADPVTFQATSISPNALALLGYPGENGSKPIEVWIQQIHPDDRDRVVDLLAKVLSNKDSCTFEHRMLTVQGATLWVRCVAQAIRDKYGQPKDLVGVAFDITPLKKTQETLHQAQEDLERLRNNLQEENIYLRQKARAEFGNSRIVGQSPAMRRVLAQAEQVAPTDSTVLLLGETGTGKELLATSIHELSTRHSHTLVSVNCAAMPGPLVESELFGREKGAFTGSLSRQVGRFELADQSTIFLDEIGELSLEVQSKLLRVLDNKQFERLGNPRPIHVNVRIIAATNQNLENAVGKGKFRQDLYYRLNVFPILVPPLRERQEDISPLVWAFVDEFAKTFNKNIESIEPESMQALQRYSWPGNVREVRNVIERAMIVATGPKLRIPLPHIASTTPAPSSLNINDVEREHFLNVLQKSGWRIRGPNGAAQKLGLKPTTLEARMAKLGINRPG